MGGNLDFYSGGADENDNITWTKMMINMDDGTLRPAGPVFYSYENGGWKDGISPGLDGIGLAFGNCPQGSWSAGYVTISWMGETKENTYLGSPSDGATLSVHISQSGKDQYNRGTWSRSATITIKFVRDSSPGGDGGGQEEPQSGYVTSNTISAYAQNYEGPIWEYYRVNPKMDFMAPAAINTDANYELYLMSSPIAIGYESELDYHGPYEIEGGNEDSAFTFFTAESGDIISYSSGSITDAFQIFSVEIPKYFFDEPAANASSYFNNGSPTEALQNIMKTIWADAKMVDYQPYSYDVNYWVNLGPTPSEWKEHSLTPGIELAHYARCPGERCVTAVSMFYRPLLVIDLSPILEFT